MMFHVSIRNHWLRTVVDLDYVIHCYVQIPWPIKTCDGTNCSHLAINPPLDSTPFTSTPVKYYG